jgi:hypothetical protein
MRQWGLAVVVLAAVAVPAHAEVTLEVVPGVEARAPELRAVITDDPALPRSQYALIDDRGVMVAASSVTAFPDGRETVALALVVQSSEIVMGNDTFIAPDAPDAIAGYWGAVVDGIAAMDLAHRLPRGSQAMLVTYDDGPHTRLAMGPAERLTPAMLGTQRDHYGKVGTDLVGGMDVALRSLANTPADLKVLVVVGDATATDVDAAMAELPMLRSYAREHAIRVYALVHEGQLSEPSDMLAFFTPNTRTYATGDALSAAMGDVMTSLAKRTTVTFPGELFVWNGFTQQMTVIAGEKELGTVPIGWAEPESDDEPVPWWQSWWKQLAIGLSSVAAIVLLMRLRAARVA